MASSPALTRSVVAASAALGPVALVAYGAIIERNAFVVREATMPVLTPGSSPLRVLHISDIHMRPGQRRKQAWLRDLVALEPDLVVNTGDSLAHRDAVPAVLESLGDLLSVPGVFVLGSNDYFEPSIRNPLRYLLPDDGQRNTHTPPLPWRELVRRFTDAGWRDLSNRRDRITVGDTTIAFAGVDDPHLGYDDLEAVAGAADPGADLRLAVAHAPYLRVLDGFARDGYDAIIAGHTHGGQVCLPGGRALTTNCDLDTARARGLHRHPRESVPGDPGSSWLHVSAGLGTSPYVRVRVSCRPEATLITLLPA